MSKQSDTPITDMSIEASRIRLATAKIDHQKAQVDLEISQLYLETQKLKYNCEQLNYTICEINYQAAQVLQERTLAAGTTSDGNFGSQINIVRQPSDKVPADPPKSPNIDMGIHTITL